MHIQALRIWNFRRLKNARIDLEKDISIFVGANNTSAAHAIGLFLGDDTDGLTVHDFSVDTWAQMDAFGAEQPDAEMPTISMDVWLTVGQNDLYRVLQLLPSVNRQGSVVGVRIEYAANDPAGLLERFPYCSAIDGNVELFTSGGTLHAQWPVAVSRVPTVVTALTERRLATPS
ncbi:AAA family ATPase [Mesorhizobium sp.]|uniref:AAA family ATPase n=1 Tax=Mesorhizobium sp. TaxID=1871066 RepID=UPI000FE8DD65|nr:AAA family ATPase [Mesorhizobium sp.]RWP37423.1 MAG: hypothetical protein EOR03_04955 [Mesorhizobium sp.]